MNDSKPYWMLFQISIVVAMCLAGTISGLSTANAAEETTAEQAPRFVSLSVYPEQIALNHADDYQRVIAIATRSDGVTRDVTGEVAWSIDCSAADEGAITIDDATVRASRNGLSHVKAQFSTADGELHAQADAHAMAADQHRAVSYRHDVIPIFLRAGCNSGGCHGSSRGKDGFSLSLFGFDPASDYQRLTRELVGRRINFALPEESLLLTKSTAGAPHTGGKRFEPDSVYYEKLLAWIEKGAPNDLVGAPTVAAVRLYPPAAALESGGGKQQFVAVAEYSNGATRDVTNLAVFLSSNDASAAIDADGMVTTDSRGEAFVMARFDTHTVGSQVLSLPPGAGFVPSDEAPANYIDELVTKKLNTVRITPAPRCTDEAFLRRVTIDIAGQLPTVAERDAFLADTSPDKRGRKIDELLERPEFAAIWANKWADLLLVRTEINRVDYKPMFLYSQWLRDEVAAGTPLDEMIHHLVSATGSTFETPATNFYQIEPDSKKIAENVAQSLLGLRIQCAQCHNHPFDRWTMDDYYAFTAFFSQIGRKRGEDYREYYIYNRGGGEARRPVDNQVMPPKFLGGDQPDVKGKDRREVVADWITSPDNPYFATSIANRVWAHFFGVGVVEPVDDIRVSNPPTNPVLFETLGEKLVEYDYDLRRLIRDIANSNTYQRSSAANESNAEDTRNFARAVPRRMPAEALLDCLSQVTDSAEKLPGLPLGSKATEIADGRGGTYFLKTFGRAARESVCACEANAEPTLSQALHLINGSVTNDKITRGKLITKWLEAGKSPAEVIDAIYLRSLTRLPTSEERDQHLKLVGDADKPAQELEDIFWAVLNSREFVFNH